MAFAQSPSASNVTSDIYSAAQQAKHIYWIYMSLIPILFCIILFMLLYMFYLRKQASPFSQRQPTFTRAPSLSSFVIPVLEVSLKEDLKDKLPTIVFDEKLKARDSLCCVCLGEFEMKEELIQVPSCNHIFHSDCICNWLCSSTTCPLCRCSVEVLVDNTELVLPPQPSPAVLLHAATPVQLASS
ncbi:putative E3 ubiquitin-protein ligase RHA4A [Heracleum sosnowskyi]|uniref:RING-type E3 ubiquitin transferase n=1 Tax=Heracleum sosnowskyi TaxID=360622 RepID=A0AAD8IJ40_9APIA|nr:putative E3 ubiquitin-protein ligase RHA4A [Heracleum sosnowskyi]